MKKKKKKVTGKNAGAKGGKGGAIVENPGPGGSENNGLGETRKKAAKPRKNK